MHPKIFLLILLLIVTPFCANAVWNLASFERPASKAALRDQIEQQLTEGGPIFTRALHLQNLLDLLFFRRTHPSLILGKQRWLFSAEEFARPNLRCLDHNLAEITKIMAQLHKRGITAYLILLPAKAEIYPQYLNTPLPAATQAGYAHFRTGLRKAVPTLIDPAQMLLQFSKAQHSFMRTDSHWSVAGAGAVAQLVAQKLEEQNPLPTQPLTTKLIDAPAQHHQGDLLNFLPLGKSAQWWGFGPEPIIPKQVQLEIGLLDIVSEETALIGTSYSAQTQWSFLDQLIHFLKRPIALHASEGEGPFAPMDEFLTAQAPNISTILWEFPIRFADQGCLSP